VENLRVTHYRNGEAIPAVTDGAAWSNLTTGAYCEYDNDPDNVATYGRLYNWFAANDDRNIAPTGWHVPSNAEWQTLVDYLGGGDIAGGKLKKNDTEHWLNPNTGATNESGFSGLPGGRRDVTGYFTTLGSNAGFWTSTADDSQAAWLRVLYHYLTAVAPDTGYFGHGFSVRCVKD
jgi:uncharacterized protein (TIGR02145 family)